MILPLLSPHLLAKVLIEFSEECANIQQSCIHLTFTQGPKLNALPETYRIYLGIYHSVYHLREALCLVEMLQADILLTGICIPPFMVTELLLCLMS